MSEISDEGKNLTPSRGKQSCQLYPKPSTNLLPPLRPLKILMIHHDCSSGPHFQHYTLPITTLLRSSLLQEISFSYPTAPNPKIPSRHSPYLQIPYNSAQVLPAVDLDSYTWGYGHWRGRRGYGWAESIRALVKYIHLEGPFEGVIGFSAGAGMVGCLVSLCERGITNPKLDDELELKSEDLPPAFNFAVMFSGFKVYNPLYASLYEWKLKTPTLHFVGRRDVMVPVGDTLEFAGRFGQAKIAWHGRGHEIPKDEEVGRVLVRFVKGVLSGKDGRGAGLKCKL